MEYENQNCLRLVTADAESSKYKDITLYFISNSLYVNLSMTNAADLF